MQITTLRPGDVYRLKDDAKSAAVFAQVGEGGDVGFFIVDDPAEINGRAPVLRVVMNEKDLRRHWANAGKLPLNNDLDRLAWYGDSDVGKDQTFKVRLDNVQDRVAIDADAYDTLEPLQVWETMHVLERLSLR